MHTNFLPLALSAIPNVDYFLNNPKVDLRILDEADANPFSEAKAMKMTPGANRVDQLFVGNFFPDMAAWDKLVPHPTRGAGGTTLRFRSRTGKNGHMSVFPPRRYKLAHRHGPGRVIVIPAGEGYTIVNPPNGEKEIIPWREGTVFTPPEQWYHQHFNVGTGQCALHRLRATPQLWRPQRAHLRIPNDQVRRRGAVDPPEIRRGAGEARPDQRYPRGRVQNPRLRVGLRRRRLARRRAAARHPERSEGSIGPGADSSGCGLRMRLSSDWPAQPAARSRRSSRSRLLRVSDAARSNSA